MEDIDFKVRIVTNNKEIFLKNCSFLLMKKKEEF